MMISFAAFLMVFTTVVLVHELGHFLAARRAGVPVYEFSIGFPFSPKIVTFFKHRETEFTLRLLPLGGFVRFSKDGDEEALDLFKASIRNRALIMSAGSLFNIAFALLVFIAVYAMGKNMPMLDCDDCRRADGLVGDHRHVRHHLAGILRTRFLGRSVRSRGYSRYLQVRPQQWGC